MLSSHSGYSRRRFVLCEYLAVRLQTVQLACQRRGATIPLPRWPEILAGRCGMAIPSARDSLHDSGAALGPKGRTYCRASMTITSETRYTRTVSTRLTLREAG